MKEANLMLQKIKTLILNEIDFRIAMIQNLTAKAMLRMIEKLQTSALRRLDRIGYER